MAGRARRWLVRAVLATLALAAGAVLWTGGLRDKISTDVLDLVPTAERHPDLALVRSLASQQTARVVLFALDSPADAPHRAEAADAFVASLRTSGAFAEVVPMADESPRETLARQVFANRFNLLLPGWLAARRREYVAAHATASWSDWLATWTAAHLEHFLTQPEALALQDAIPSDPLLLVAGAVRAASVLPQPATHSDGPVLVWAKSRAAPLSEFGQQPVLAAVRTALTAATKIEPGTRVRWSAIARFAARSRARIEHELRGLNLLSIAAVFVVGAMGLRRMYKAAHLVPVIVGGLLGAWLATLLAFDRVHVLVFVVGSLLAGVAVDYGFYLTLQPPAHPGEPYRSRVRRLLKPLLASALTTILGFSLLLFSDLPLIRELGVFVSAGLLCSLGTALLWFAQVPEPFVATRGFIRHQWRRDARTRVTARVVLGAALLAALVGIGRLRWRDDIRELEIPAPALRAESDAVHQLFGEDPHRLLFLSHGSTIRAARAALASFQTWEQQRAPKVAVGSLAAIVPTPADYDALPANLAGLEEFPATLQRALAARDFTSEAFAPFFRDWAAWSAVPRPSYEEAVAQLAASLHGPLSMLMSAGDGSAWFASVVSDGATEDPPPELATTSLRQLETLNRLFARYRISAARLSGIGLLALGASVLALYGIRRGWRIFAVPAGACLTVAGLLGLAHQELNLFHLLGAFLGVCLSHNYAIFSAENALRHEESPPSVRLSALTTAASFGTLALSQIPVVAALGATVSLIVIVALVIVELQPLAFAPFPTPRSPSP